MTDVVIVDAIRTPVGARGGILASVRPDDLAALVIKEIVQRNRLDPVLVEEVVFGCANQAGEDNRNVARMAALLAGLPVEVAGVTVNRLCASGLNAINQAARAIKSRLDAEGLWKHVAANRTRFRKREIVRGGPEKVGNLANNRNFLTCHCRSFTPQPTTGCCIFNFGSFKVETSSF